VGIPPPMMKHMFELFHSRRGIAGTGLGLAVAKKIVGRSTRDDLGEERRRAKAPASRFRLPVFHMNAADRRTRTDRRGRVHRVMRIDIMLTGENRMPTSDLQSPKRIWTAADLRRLPRDQRDAVLAAAAALAEADYKTDPQLTAFDRVRRGDFHGDSSGTANQPR